MPLLLGLIALAARHQRDVERGVAHIATADRLDDIGNLRLLGEQRGDLRRDTRGLLELHAGRQFDGHLRCGEIRARVERFRDRDQQADRNDEEERTARERRTAMRQRPAQRLEITLHHRPIC